MIMSFQNIWDQDRWKLGKNLGMFNYGAGGAAPLVSGEALNQSAPNFAQRLNTLYSSPEFKALPENAKEISVVGALLEGFQPKLSDKQKELELSAKYNRDQALFAQQLGKESMGIASMYNQLNKLPQTIASAFGAPDDRALMAATYGNIPSIVSETYRTFPRQQISPVGYSATSTKYFS